MADLANSLGASTNSLGSSNPGGSINSLGTLTPSNAQPTPLGTGANFWAGLTEPGAYAGMASQVAARSENLAQQQLTEYEKGQLQPGTQASIDRAYQTVQNALVNTFAGAGRDPSGDTTYAGGVADLANVKSIAEQNALEQLLQDYYTTTGQETQAAQVGGQIAVGHESNKIQQEANQASQKGGLSSIFGSLLGGIGKLFSAGVSGGGG